MEQLLCGMHKIRRRLQVKFRLQSGTGFVGGIIFFHGDANFATRLELEVLTNTISVAQFAAASALVVLANATAAARCALPSPATVLANGGATAVPTLTPPGSMNTKPLLLIAANYNW